MTHACGDGVVQLVLLLFTASGMAMVKTSATSDTVLGLGRLVESGYDFRNYSLATLPVGRGNLPVRTVGLRAFCCCR